MKKNEGFLIVLSYFGGWEYSGRGLGVSKCVEMKNLCPFFTNKVSTTHKVIIWIKVYNKHLERKNSCNNLTKIIFVN